jgi:hypothetical protein
MNALLELAERCEQAAGDDATALIHLEADIRAALMIDPESQQRPFTSSLDAAMTLAPEGWAKYAVDADDGGCIFELETDDDQKVEVHARTWALALCAAALRARAAL